MTILYRALKEMPFRLQAAALLLRWSYGRVIASACVKRSTSTNYSESSHIISACRPTTLHRHFLNFVIVCSNESSNHFLIEAYILRIKHERILLEHPYVYQCR